MPPHCDSLDGPVVAAARRALDSQDVDMVLPFVHKAGEDEVRRAFELAVKARAKGGEARTVADLFFFETAVRVHRAGEGAPYTGLKPAGLDVGPVIPIAERAIEAAAGDALAAFLADEARREVEHRFQAMLRAKQHAGMGVDGARAYVQAMLGLQVWAHSLYGAIHARGHENGHHGH